MKPATIRRIYYIDWFTLALFFLGIVGVVVPLFVPVSEIALLAATISVPIVSALFLLNLVALMALGSEKPWGMKYHTAYSVLMLFFFPLGTILHGYVLYELARERETWKYFQRGA